MMWSKRLSVRESVYMTWACKPPHDIVYQTMFRNNHATSQKAQPEVANVVIATLQTDSFLAVEHMHQERHVLELCKKAVLVVRGC